MSLRKHGASRDASVAFLISTPQTVVDSIMVTLSMLGPVFAIIRPVAALITGALGGIMTFLFGERDETASNNGAHSEIPGGACCTSGSACTDSCSDASSGKNRFVRVLEYGFRTLPSDIGKFMLYGLLIAAVITIAVPDDFFLKNLGAGIAPMLVMMLVGIPMYVCSSASVPIVAALMHHAGLTPGAALVFLMTGPATNAATITTIWKVLGKKTALLYLFSIAAGAIVFGIALDFFIKPGGGAMMMHNHWMMPAWINTASAIVLIPILAQAFFRKAVSETKSTGCVTGAAGADTEQKIELSISGMSCSHCVANVTRAINEFPGVSSVHVDLESGAARISGIGLDPEKISSAITQLGYSVKIISS